MSTLKEGNKIPICPKCHSAFLEQTADSYIFQCRFCKTKFRLKPENTEPNILFAIKTEVLRKLLDDKEFAKKLAECKSFEQAQNLIAEFAKKKGFKVKVLRYGD